MPIDPNASAITPAWAHASLSMAGISLSTSLLSVSLERHGIGQTSQHLRDARIVRRAAVDVAIDGFEPPRQLGAGDAACRVGRVDEKIHLGRGALSGERHEVAEPGDPEAAEPPV